MKVVGLLGALNWKANEFDEPNTYVHDAGATLFVNGEHIRSINEERLTRVKDDGSFPRKSIDYVLGDEYKKEDIDIVESVQRGMMTPAFTQGRIVNDPEGSGKSEHAVHHFHGLVLDSYAKGQP